MSEGYIIIPGLPVNWKTYI